MMWILSSPAKRQKFAAAQRRTACSCAAPALWTLPQVITMEDDAKSVLRSKKDSSLGVAFQLLKAGEGDALVSAGNTGAVTVGATLITGRIKGLSDRRLPRLCPLQASLFDDGLRCQCRMQAGVPVPIWAAWFPVYAACAPCEKPAGGSGQ